MSQTRPVDHIHIERNETNPFHHRESPEKNTILQDGQPKDSCSSSPSSTQEPTYKSLLVHTMDTPMKEKKITTTFDLCEASHNRALQPDIIDDDTDIYGTDYFSQSLSIMFVKLGTNKYIDEEEASLKAIFRINAMSKSLINKISSLKSKLYIGRPIK